MVILITTTAAILLVEPRSQRAQTCLSTRSWPGTGPDSARPVGPSVTRGNGPGPSPRRRGGSLVHSPRRSAHSAEITPTIRGFSHRYLGRSGAPSKSLSSAGRTNDLHQSDLLRGDVCA